MSIGLWLGAIRPPGRIPAARGGYWRVNCSTWPIAVSGRCALVKVLAVDNGQVEDHGNRYQSGTDYGMLRITKLTDYAIVVLTHMARGGAASWTSREAAVTTGLPQPSVSKILKSFGPQQEIPSNRHSVRQVYRWGISVVWESQDNVLQR